PRLQGQVVEPEEPEVLREILLPYFHSIERAEAVHNQGELVVFSLRSSHIKKTPMKSLGFFY
ncbi:MAG: hypothetical protein ACJA2P_001431, partial [Rhodoferax sp.]